MDQSWGPLLFIIIYITSLGSIIQRHCPVSYFTLMTLSSTLHLIKWLIMLRNRLMLLYVCAAMSATAIEEIRCWMKLNFLKLIEKKRKYLLISSAYMRNTIIGISISVADKTATPSEKAKHLGVIFDRTMTTCILPTPQDCRDQTCSNSCRC